MKLAHNVKLSVFCYEGEDEEKVKSKLLSLFPFDLGKEKLSLDSTVAEGFNERKITILEILLSKEKHTSKFLASLKERLAKEQRSLLIMQADTRLDSEFNFFIRLDKAKLLEEDAFWITDCGNCFHIKITLASFPKTRDAALKVVQKWLS